MRRLIITLLILCAAATGFAIAQDDERSRFVRFVERQISTPDRQIRLGAIDGALSSDVRISQITISDREGVWLTIEGVHLIWSRLALVRGRLDIDLLEATAIRIDRLPLSPEDAAPSPESGEFQLPELPVSVLLDRLNVERVELAEPVIGTAAALSILGNLRLAGGELDTTLEIDRLDREGELDLTATFDNESRQLAVDLSLNEPAGGVVAEALNIEGRDAIALTVKGAGPLSDFTADIALQADGETIVSGTSEISQTPEGLRFQTDISGNLDELVAELYQPLVAGGSAIVVDVLRRDDGSVSLRRGTLQSGAARLDFAAELGSDFVPLEFDVDGVLERGDNQPIPLPFGGDGAAIGSARITATLPGPSGNFAAEIAIQDLDTDIIAAPRATLRASGTVADLADPATRSATFTVSGNADDLRSDDGDVADALGSRLDIDAAGSWQAGAPVRMDRAAITTDTLSASFEGTISSTIDGAYSVRADDISAFSGLAGRDLSGAVDLSARGTAGFDGVLDLTLDSTFTDLSVGVDAADGLLAGTTRITGRAARTGDGVAFDDFRVENQRMVLAADGSATEAEANLIANVELADLADLSPQASGPISASLTVRGAPAAPSVAAAITSPQLVLAEKVLRDLSARFDGTYTRSDIAFDLDGEISVSGELEGEPLSLSAQLESGETARTLRDLTARIAGASASGTLALRDDGLYDGELSLSVPELARVAPLALVEAEGSLELDLSLRAEGERQAATLDGTARQVEAAGVSLGFADIDMAVSDVFGVPALDGRAEVRALRVAGYDVRSADLRANRDGEATNLTVRADLGSAELDAAGSLERQDDGFAAQVDRFTLGRGGFAATLEAPTSVTVAGETITISPTRLSVGGGEVTLEGVVGNALDVDAVLREVPLSVANLVRPDLGVGGTVSGEVRLTGPREAPEGRAELDATGVTAAYLTGLGIEPLSATATARFSDGSVTLEAFRTSIGGGTVTATGTLGEMLDLSVSADALPLALANAVAPDLALSGTVSATADVTGSLSDPAATFDATLVDASAAPLRSAGLDPLNARVEGRFADGTAVLSTAQAAVGGGTVVASGSIGRDLDVTVTLDGLPLALAEAVAPDLDLTGTLSGTVTATGSLASPVVVFSLESGNASAARLSAVGPAAIDVSGTFRNGTATLDDAFVRVAGGEARATGTVGRRIDLAVDLTGVPLSLADIAAPELGLSGSLSGRIDATGSLARPAASFDISVASFSAARLRAAGIEPLTVAASGRFENQTVTLTSLNADGALLSVSATGTVPLSGGGLDLQVEARAPLALLDSIPAVTQRGARVTGQAVADLRVSGALSDPNITGNVTASGVGVTDPQTGLVVESGTVDLALTGSAIEVRRLTASLGDGTVSVTGRVGLGNGFPADLDVVMDNARFTDGRLVAVTLDGSLTVTGPLTGEPLVAGNIEVIKAEIAIPESGGGIATLIDVTHLYPPADVIATLRRARVGPYAEEEDGGSASGLRLDVNIDAPSRIFVRGRGIDAELGGRVRLTGPISDVRPIGQFELIRGRLSILGQRIQFVEGAITLFGDLNPTIRLVAEKRARDITARVTVEGSVREPQITLSSEPDLPQDEVLAQLIFGRSLDELTGFQLAQLAVGAAELAGGGSGPSLLDQIRVFAGLDNFEILTDEEGGVAAEAGRYIGDRVYLGIRAGENSSGVTVNIDITRGLTARAEALTDESTIGIFYEREY